MHKRRWWWGAAIVSAACVTVIVLAWQHKIGTYLPRAEQLDTSEVVQAQLGEYLRTTRDAPVFVPTGIFIQSLAFLNAADVNITGYVWQKYDDTVSSEITRGFVFPEQVDSSGTVLEIAYRHREEGVEVIGWYFDATVRQPFDYSDYPLDRHDIWLRLWHADFARNIILTPDLDAYNSHSKLGIFGVDEEIVPGGWAIEDTYFHYRFHSYDTNFGITDYVGKRNFPELYYNIVVGRKFRNAFIINLVPLLVVAVLLFGVLMMVTGEQPGIGRFGLKTMDVVATASALFFVVMLAHIQLRERFAGAHIVYLEYFYLVSYIAILLVALNAYLFARRREGRYGFISHHDNFFPKVVFWPALLGTLAVITVVSMRG
jgi:hypothetical protein